MVVTMASLSRGSAVVLRSVRTLAWSRQASFPLARAVDELPWQTTTTTTTPNAFKVASRIDVSLPSSSSSSSSSRSSGARWLGAAFGAAGLGFLAKPEPVYSQQAGEHLQQQQQHDCHLQRVFSRADVEQHNTTEAGIWVIRGDKVYDITEFVQNHPGGASKIMLAAGKSVDPFWRVYQQHLGNEAVEELLREMQIGVLDPKDAEGLAGEADPADPFAREPATHPALSVHYAKPVNAEIPPSLLMDSWITPNELWYVRHHHPVPMEAIDDDAELGLDLSVAVGGGGEKEAQRIRLSLEDLKRDFEKKKVVATMQCGGNRRGGLNGVDGTKGTSWDVGAISNAEWAGVPLAALLVRAGVDSPEAAERMGIKHVQFESHDGMLASIPIEKALNPYGDAIVAYEMNGEPIPRKNGYPLRAIVPGFVGVRNVKWLKSITLSSEESEGPWQRGMNYKVFSPSVKDLNGVDIASVPTIQEQPVQSVIVSPADGERIEVIEGEELEIRGYSWSGGGRGVIRVDVSVDGGKTWHTAKLGEGSNQNPNRAWAWTFWEATVPAPALKGGEAGTKVDICCKATDYAHNCQPETPDSIWNLRGLNNNSWHHVKVVLEDALA